MIDPDTRIEEWFLEDGGKCKGPRIDGKRQGIVRVVRRNFICLTQFKDDKQHGLDIIWSKDGFLSVFLNKDGDSLGHIEWDTKNWTEVYRINKSVFDSVLSINDFRP